MKKIALLLILFTSIASQAQTIYEQRFTNGRSGWISVDADGDGSTWGLIDIGYDDDISMASPSFDYANDAALTPDNWLISPVIELPQGAAAERIILSYMALGYDSERHSERYRLYIKEEVEGADPTDVSQFVNYIWQETLSKGRDFELRSHNLSSYAGTNIRLAFRHYGSTNQSMILLDNILLEHATDAPNIYISNIISPRGGSSLGKDLTVTVTLANKGLVAATGVKATYVAPGGFTVTENVPDLAAGRSIEFSFATKIPRYEEIVRNGEISISVTAEGERDTSDNEKTGIFQVIPYGFLAGWDFEDDAQRTEFKTDFTLKVNDEFRVEAPEVVMYFPQNEAATLLVAAQQDFPTEFWGTSFLATTAAFSFQGAADRMIILPKTYLDGTQLTFSWTSAMLSLGMLATSDLYQVLISDTGTEPENFVAIGETIVEFGNIESPYERMVNISDYAGKEVYMAFRIVSERMKGLSSTLLLLDNFQFWTYGRSGSSIEELKEKETKHIIYPNPVQDILNIEHAEDIKSIEIFSVLGQLVHKSFVPNNSATHQIDVNHLPANVYVVRMLTSDGHIVSSKFTKN